MPAENPRESDESLGRDMYELLARLFPICRSLTGRGVRETLRILSEHIPLTVHEVPTGTKAFDWTVPKEWNIRDAYIADASGRKIVTFQQSNLHVVGYSIPIDRQVSLSELNEHLYSLPGQPDAIPYVTSYYEEHWGFCLTHTQRQSLADATYHVHIDSDLTDGCLTYGELLIPGASEQEVLLSTYVCHPSLANNELSGPVVTAFLAKWIAQEPRKYTYRIVFVPETIGSLVYLSRHLEILKQRTIAGFNVTCVGDDRAFSFLPSRHGGTLADRVALNVLSFAHPDFVRYSYLDRQSDERQYCSPGADLPVVSIMRSKYGEYPEYHTSLDDLTLVTPTGLQGAYDVLRACVELLERNDRYRVTCIGEPQLGKRGLYPNVSTPDTRTRVRTMLNVLAYADGATDVVELSTKIQVPAPIVLAVIDQLQQTGLVVACGQTS